jgi:hypothetical protein
MIGQPWELTDGQVVRLAEPQEFVQFTQPDYAKVTMNFYIAESKRPGCLKVSTESRIYVADPKTRNKFARYWFVIYLGSSYIRTLMLQAVKRRAEQQ